MEVCCFRTCLEPVAPLSRVCCQPHELEVAEREAELRDRTAHRCLYHWPKLRGIAMPSTCPTCGGGSIARAYPISARRWRCQAPASWCGKLISEEG